MLSLAFIQMIKEFSMSQFPMIGSSCNRMGSVIELVTGLPADYEVLSNFYFKCKAVGGGGDFDLEWLKRHKVNESIFQYGSNFPFCSLQGSENSFWGNIRKVSEKKKC